MKVRVELHTHTNFSHDSLLNKWFYLLMLKLRKINVIGITDHNEIMGAIKFKNFLEKFNIRVIVGEEIFSDKGEIIGLFLKEKIKLGLSPRETMLAIKEQGGIVYIPHPYDKKRYKTVLVEEEIKNNVDLIDIIEMHNGRNVEEYYSQNQLEIAEKYEKVKSVGSDAHTFIELGRNYNIMEDFNNELEFLENLQAGKYNKRSCIQLSHQITKFARVIKLLRKGQINEIYRIIHKKYNRRKQQIGPEGK
jgi:predicted metal-dependent phosphoesterase TrpH